MSPSEHELHLTEDDPLLNGDEPSDEEGETHYSHPEPRVPFRASPWQLKTPRQVIIMLAVIKFSVVCTGMMMLLPLARLIEDLFCHVHYKENSLEIIDEMKCKVEEIQSRMAYLSGWSGILSSVIGLLVAFPYGMMADKIGRRPTVIFAYFGVMIPFSFGPFMLRKYQLIIRQNPYLMMWGSVFQLFGGGIPVMLSTIYAIAADVSTEKEKASNFLYLTFGATAGGLLGPVIGGLLMQRYGPWVPINIVLFVFPCILVLLFLLPETLTMDLKKQKAHTGQQDSFKEQMRHGIKELVKSLEILKTFSVPLVLVTFFVQNARFTAYTTTLSQYISVNFKWKLAETSLLLSPLGLLNLVVLGVLPTISKILVSPRFRMTPFGKDLFLTKVSTCILVVGALVQGLGHNVIMFIFGLFICTFGAADSPLARATVTHYVPPEYTSRLYALIGMIEVVGSFIGGPVLAWFFDKGMKKGGFWMGLPWFYVSFLCFLAFGALLFVVPPGKTAMGDPRDEVLDDWDDYLPDNPLRLD